MGFRLLSEHRALTGESPLWDPDRRCLWWIDIQAQFLLQTGWDGVTRHWPLPSQPGLIALAQSGRLVIGLENGLWSFSPEENDWQCLSETEADRPTHRLNDGKPDRAGRLWFGSMDMTGSYRATGRLYRRDPGGCVETVLEGVGIPNAIVPFADGNGLAFCDTATGRLDRLHTNACGEITQRSLLRQFEPDWRPDGACLDNQGHIWLAIIGPGLIVRLDPRGNQVDVIQSPVSRPTMPALGGPDSQSLFLTSQRRFLDTDALSREPEAGGLHLLTAVPARSGPMFRVAGV